MSKTKKVMYALLCHVRDTCALCKALLTPFDLHEILACIRLECQDNEISGHIKAKVRHKSVGVGYLWCLCMQDIQWVHCLQIVLIMSLGTAVLVGVSLSSFDIRTIEGREVLTLRRPRHHMYSNFTGCHGFRCIVSFGVKFL